MKVGDLVKYKHFPEETAVVVKIHPDSSVDVLSNLGEIASYLNPDTFEVVNETR